MCRQCGVACRGGVTKLGLCHSGLPRSLPARLSIASCLVRLTGVFSFRMRRREGCSQCAASKLPRQKSQAPARCSRSSLPARSDGSRQARWHRCEATSSAHGLPCTLATAWGCTWRPAGTTHSIPIPPTPLPAPSAQASLDFAT